MKGIFPAGPVEPTPHLTCNLTEPCVHVLFMPILFSWVRFRQVVGRRVAVRPSGRGTRILRVPEVEAGSGGAG